MSTFAHQEPSEEFVLPAAPTSQGGPVKAWAEAVSLPTYLPGAPDKNPIFSETRVYPLPVIGQAAAEQVPHLWQAIHLENEFIRVMILPERGGKIHIGVDKTTGSTFFYRQGAIQPAPTVQPPVSTYLEEHPDGARTVWCSSHDPVSRIKNMQGICLYPGRAYLEVKVRLFNRTPVTQVFSMSSFSVSADPHAGLVHVADQQLQPGSFLVPFETKAFSEFWYPIQKIGAVRKANVDAAVSLLPEDGAARVGVCVTRAFPKATVVLQHGQTVLAQWTHDLYPGKPSLEDVSLPPDLPFAELTLNVLTSTGRPLISYTPHGPDKAEALQPATEPPLPRKVETVEELYLIGLHLWQYRHAMRHPEDYWREGLRRSPRDSRCNNAMGLRHLWRGDFIEAEAHFRRAITTLTAQNLNPAEGEPFYNLGLALRYQERDDEAYDAFSQAAGSFAWRAPALYAMAEVETKRGNYGAAPQHLREALRLNADNNNARNLAAVLFRRFGRTNEADHLLRESLALDPLDAWACHLSGRQIPGNNQTRLDLAFDYARSGLYEAAVEVLTAADTFVADGSLPMVHYALAGFYMKTGDFSASQREFLAASQSPPDYCFPHRPEELSVLARAAALQPHDARAQYYLGNLLYDRQRHAEAMELWESSAQLDESFATIWRNLGIGYYNINNDVPKAFAAFDKALSLDPADARVLYERDQLWKRTGVPPALRLKELEEHQKTAELRDDLALEMTALFNNVNQPVRALAMLSSRRFQSPEGQGGPALEQHVRTHLKLGRQSLDSGEPMRALHLFLAALNPPANIGEARHASAKAAEVQFWVGEGYYGAHDLPSAKRYWQQAADAHTNFQATAAKPYSETTFYSALALARLGESSASRNLLRQVWFYGRQLAREKSQQIDYFAVSRPAAIFREDLGRNSRITGLFLQAQARLGLGQFKLARNLLQQVLELNPNYGRALDLAGEVARAQS